MPQCTQRNCREKAGHSWLRPRLLPGWFHSLLPLPSCARLAAQYRAQVRLLVRTVSCTDCIPWWLLSPPLSVGSVTGDGSGALCVVPAASEILQMGNRRLPMQEILICLICLRFETPAAHDDDCICCAPHGNNTKHKWE